MADNRTSSKTRAKATEGMSVRKQDLEAVTKWFESIPVAERDKPIIGAVSGEVHTPTELYDELKGALREGSPHNAILKVSDAALGVFIEIVRLDRK
jgi:hypothetical protein